MAPACWAVALAWQLRSTCVFCLLVFSRRFLLLLLLPAAPFLASALAWRCRGLAAFGHALPIIAFSWAYPKMNRFLPIDLGASMKNRIRTWAAPAKRTASLLIAMLLAASMLFYGAPFALVGGALQGSAPSVGAAAAEELGQQSSGPTR